MVGERRHAAAHRVAGSTQDPEEEIVLDIYRQALPNQPNLRLIYVTSETIQPSIIDYYLQILPGAIISNGNLYWNLKKN